MGFKKHVGPFGSLAFIYLRLLDCSAGLDYRMLAGVCPPTTTIGDFDLVNGDYIFTCGTAAPLHPASDSTQEPIDEEEVFSSVFRNFATKSTTISVYFGHNRVVPM
jgi:hypothetical protein